MSAPERINIVWRDNEPDDGFIEYTTIGRFIVDVDGAESVDYVRADLVDPAAIREAALREALVALRGAGSFGRTASEKHASLEQYCLCRDAILALIDKPTPDHSATPGNMIDKGAE